MKLGIVVPQGFTGEFAGWSPDRAWARTLAVARRADDVGVESVWVYDHVGTFGTPRDEPTLEAFAVLGALAASTSRVRLGPLVARASLRNPALLAKHVSTLDVISGGRFELGLGAAAPREETLSYGYDLAPFGERVALLREALAITRAMFTDGRATVAGVHARADGAIDNPRGVQTPRIPMTVGGTNPATWRVAAEIADEINLDGPPPDAARDALATIGEVCHEAGRDPATLRVSVHMLPRDVATPGPTRTDLFAAYAALGISRVMALVPGAAASDDAIEAFIADARAAGVELG